MVLAMAVGLIGIFRGEASEIDPFSMIVIPDTQYDSDQPEVLNAMTDWIVANRDTENIRFVSHVGDLVEWSPTGESLSQSRWANLREAMYRLDGQIPYSILCGNHDYEFKNGETSGAAGDYLNSFGPAHFAGAGWYRGSSPDGLSSYQILNS
ncbi:MAG: metallophosphoesterase [Verrucomicrobiota bacterium]